MTHGADVAVGAAELTAKHGDRFDMSRPTFVDRVTPAATAIQVSWPPSTWRGSNRPTAPHLAAVHRSLAGHHGRRSGRLRVARWFSFVLLEQQGLRHRGGGDGFFALLLGCLQRAGEVGEFAT
ncbi:hypothetical protein [Nonomuraea fuscirosea]|uniref:hypothetical protein n=1 Tax=Nonomuraea fuscirosea TaxID=1291556 RepID=UPI0033EC80A7